jgi:two-component system chemotaxis response regulator CheB
LIQVKAVLPSAPDLAAMAKSQEATFNVVAIGGSAGALPAVKKLLAALPIQFHAAIVLCVHRPVERESAMAAILARAGHCPVVIPRHGEHLKPGICYLGHPNTHLAVGPGLVAQSVHDGFYRAHNIDLLFSSLARNAGPRTIGVLLSGYAKDGVEGLRAIKEAGGKAFVQSPSEAEVDTLPRNALSYDGSIDMVAPVAELAAEIARLTGSANAFVRSESEDTARPAAEDESD